ncbi:hypothetical protein TNCV_1569221 [Trichonephila clavipes]|nr:hypothetical protein TNCV_1569221 [Trichonephila clavipes]
MNRCLHPKRGKKRDYSFLDELFISRGSRLFCGIVEGRLSVLATCFPMPLRHGGTLNSHRPTRSLAWLVEGQERWEAPAHPQGILPLNWGGAEQNRTVTCMVL